MKSPVPNHSNPWLLELDQYGTSEEWLEQLQKFNDLVEQYDPTVLRWRAVYLEPSNEELGRCRAFAASCKYVF